LDASELTAYVGRYESDEAETTFEVVIDGGTLVLTRRPATRIPMRPTARDAFAIGGQTMTFHRGAGGEVEAMSIAGSRVFDMRFARASAVSSAGMQATATGTFDVKMGPQAFENAPDGALLSRFTLDKTFQGDLTGTSQGQMLAAGTAVKDSAGYVAIEVVSGTLGGRTGTFALQHTGTMNRGAPSLSITVVPDSGTGGLAGISGTLTIRIEGGKHFYDFTYTLPK
jgi:hypothetical protein